MVMVSLKSTYIVIDVTQRESERTFSVTVGKAIVIEGKSIYKLDSRRMRQSDIGSGKV